MVPISSALAGISFTSVYPLWPSPMPGHSESYNGRRWVHPPVPRRFNSTAELNINQPKTKTIALVPRSHRDGLSPFVLDADGPISPVHDLLHAELLESGTEGNRGLFPWEKSMGQRETLDSIRVS